MLAIPVKPALTLAVSNNNALICRRCSGLPRLGSFLAGKDGHALRHGNWGLYVLILVMMILTALTCW